MIRCRGARGQSLPCRHDARRSWSRRAYRRRSSPGLARASATSSGERLRRHRRIDGEHHRHRNRLAHRLEVLQRDRVLQIRLDRWIDDEARKHHEQRVPVARGARAELVADHRTGARAGSPRSPAAPGPSPAARRERGSVRSAVAARRKGYDDADGLRGERSARGRSPVSPAASSAAATVRAMVSATASKSGRGIRAGISPSSTCFDLGARETS